MFFCFKVAANFISAIRETLITRLRIWLFSKQKKQTFESDVFFKNRIRNVRFFKQLYKSPTYAGFFTEGTYI